MDFVYNLGIVKEPNEKPNGQMYEINFFSLIKFSIIYKLSINQTKLFIMSSSYRLPKRISNLQDPTSGSNVTSDSPLMKCLLTYARLERLEVRGDVVKSFWRFFTSASLIFNKVEFINSCIPELLPR